MQALFETIFDILYLGGVLLLGISMIRSSSKGSTRWLFGIMAVILGCGDAFHLVPRSYALWTTGLEAHAVALGIGKFITSLTMTVFYLLLYYVWRKHYKIQGETFTTLGIWALAALRVVLCFLPGNMWTSATPSLAYGIFRNIPFGALGILIIFLFIRENKKSSTSYFQGMPLAISLSFSFYIPVVLFSHILPVIGMLMIPKTLAYVWIVLMGYRLPKESL